MLKYLSILVCYIIFFIPYQISGADIHIDYNLYRDKIETIHKQKIKEVVNKVIQCESEGKHNVWGDLNLKYPVYGIAQMQYRTFRWLSNISGKKGMKWKNKDHQIQLLEWALQNDLGELWTCYRILAKKGEI